MSSTTKLRKEADLALSDKRWSDAVTHYETLQVAGAYQDDPTFMSSFGLACLESGRYGDACRWASEAIKLGSKTAYYLRGSAAFEVALRRSNLRMGELCYAQRDLRLVVSFFPDDQMGWKKLNECDGFIADLKDNPPDFFPLELRDPLSQPACLRARRRAALLTGDFEILDRANRTRCDQDWVSFGNAQSDAKGKVRYASPPCDFVEDPDFPVGEIYVVNRDGNFPALEPRQFVAVWQDGGSEQHEENFHLRSLGEIVVEHLGEGRLLGFGPSVDEFCLKEPIDMSSPSSRVTFDVNTFWTVAVFWKALQTTGVKPWDDEIAAMKNDGIPDLLIGSGEVARVDEGSQSAKTVGGKVAEVGVSRSAAELKTSGNAFFKEKRWQDAVRCYDAALKVLTIRDSSDMQIALHANLSQCYLNMELFRRAVESASACLDLDWRNQKALFRRALAFEKLNEIGKAMDDVDALLKMDPAHSDGLAVRSRLQAKNKPKQREAAQPCGRSATNQQIEWRCRAMPTAGSAAWCEGLESKGQYEWFVDVYRLRLDDDCVASGSEMRGIYKPGVKRGDVLEDFLSFCKLAHMRNIFPLDWDWQDLLQTAAGRLSNTFSFECLSSSDGADSARWQSLRAGAKIIYGQSPDMENMQTDVKNGLRTVDPNLFDDVGGSSAWHRLLKQLPDLASKKA